MANYAPNAMELASRDVVSRAEQTEIDEGRGVDGCVLLDLTHLGAKKINTRLPGSRELAMDYAGVDPIDEPIPVRPGAHYHMGGVDTDVLRAHDPAGPVRRRRVRLRLGARRQPPGRQLAARDRRVRPPRRAPPPAQDVRSNGNGGARVRRRRCATPSAGIARDARPAAAAQRPHVLREELADTMYDERRRLPHRASGSSAAWPTIGELRERCGRGVVVARQGPNASTPT